ncbi:MAG: FKBP-type peptidyl-prolyl cis-trans isomerase [Planctomycetes bacterium]|nr:FKBP-type peptidyl-prolyl cis-trans isomerase [Planctomycetota bacterium]
MSLFHRSRSYTLLLPALLAGVGCAAAGTTAVSPLSESAAPSAPMPAVSPGSSPPVAAAGSSPAPVEVEPLPAIDPAAFSETPSGLRYVIIAPGSGLTPLVSDQLVVEVRGWVDGRERRPFLLLDAAAGAARGYTGLEIGPAVAEALLNMRLGARWRLRAPARLAFGATGAPGSDVPPNADVNYDVTLHGLYFARVPEQPDDPGASLPGPAPAGFAETASGLRFRVERPGSGETPRLGDPVACRYAARLLGADLTPGALVVASPPGPAGETGQPARCFTGLAEMLIAMKPGEKRTALVPARLAFGATGKLPAVPPNAHLFLEAELPPPTR